MREGEYPLKSASHGLSGFPHKSEQEGTGLRASVLVTQTKETTLQTKKCLPTLSQFGRLRPIWEVLGTGTCWRN